VQSTFFRVALASNYAPLHCGDSIIQRMAPSDCLKSAQQILSKKNPPLFSLSVNNEGKNSWQLPTFPGNPSIIGSSELNYRVRYGNGCDLTDITTKKVKISI